MPQPGWFVCAGGLLAGGAWPRSDSSMCRSTGSHTRPAQTSARTHVPQPHQNNNDDNDDNDDNDNNDNDRIIAGSAFC